MAFCRLVFPLLVLSVASCYASVPVFLWGDLAKTSNKFYPLEIVTGPEFRQVLKHELVEQPLTVVFVEKGLSVEDFSSKNADGKTSFEYLQSNLEDSSYMPSVDNALDAIKRFAGADRSDSVTLTQDGLSEGFLQETSEGRFFFISLEDANEGEPRSDLLRRHDKFMEEVMSELKKNSKVVAIYTAEYPSWTMPILSRSRRAATFEGLNGLRMTTTNITIKSGNNTEALGDLASASGEANDTLQTNTLKFENQSISLAFTVKGGYWFFDTVTLTLPTGEEEQLLPVEEVFAIVGFSYRCLEYVSFASVNQTKSYQLTFENLKIQPFFVNNVTLPEFGDAFNCVGFFTAPIWSGLFVVFILLLITFYGIMMMLDIRTMDRFDDPKGKTITINAGE